VLQTVPDVRVREKGKTERWRVRRSGRIHKQNHKEPQNTISVRTQRDTTRRYKEREREEHVNLPTSLPTYLPAFLPSYLLISLLTYLPAFSYHESEAIF
jgi:hypothetical protein